MLTIEILGQPFTFSTDSDVSDAGAVADYVVRSVDQASKQCAQKTLTPDKWAVLILAALNITSDYFDLKSKHEQLLDEISQRSATLLHTLESQLA